MNLTGVFHGSLGPTGGNKGRPAALSPPEYRGKIQIGFDTFEDCLKGLKDLVDLGISKQSMVSTVSRRQ